MNRLYTMRLNFSPRLSVVLITGLFFVASPILESCSKYEEGPRLSLRSRTKRLRGEWQIARQETYINDVLFADLDLTQLQDTTMIFTVSGDWSRPSPDSSRTDYGKWTFIGKNNIMLTSEVTEEAAIWEIKKLKFLQAKLEFNDTAFVIGEPVHLRNILHLQKKKE